MENFDRACIRTLLASRVDAVQVGVWSNDAAFSVAASLNSHAVVGACRGLAVVATRSFVLLPFLPVSLHRFYSTGFVFS